MATFYIIRHAAKEFGGFYNPTLRHQDEPINPRGRQQAEKVSEFFAEIPVSEIYISEYQRTAQTIAPTASRLGLTPVIDRRINEFDNGVIEGMSDVEIQRTYPHVWQAFQLRNADFRFPEGETGEEALQRAVEFLEEKRQQAGNNQIILVSHDGLIRLMMCHITGIPVYRRWNFRVDFCGLTEITYQPDYAAWKLIRFNQNIT
jgi:broad specificity phosphatase PhoE